MKTYGYYVDLDERGTFQASVRDENDQIVYNIDNSEDAFDIFECGFMRHKGDLDGLTSYLVDLGVLKRGDRILSYNQYQALLEREKEDESES